MTKKRKLPDVPCWAELEQRWQRVVNQRTRKREQVVYRRETRRASGPKIIAALKDMASATGDPRFTAAVQAIKEHRYDRQHAGTWRQIKRIAAEVAYARAMETLIWKGWPERKAAGQVAIDFMIAGANLKSVVATLVHVYRRSIT
jgi:hypothetical protein